jgi:hypothetical protein
MKELEAALRIAKIQTRQGADRQVIGDAAEFAKPLRDGSRMSADLVRIRWLALTGRYSF